MDETHFKVLKETCYEALQAYIAKYPTPTTMAQVMLEVRASMAKMAPEVDPDVSVRGLLYGLTVDYMRANPTPAREAVYTHIGQLLDQYEGVAMVDSAMVDIVHGLRQ